MRVVGSELEVPFHFAGVEIERDQRGSIEIVALAPRTVVVGPGVPGGPVKCVRFRIVGAGEPRRCSAIFYEAAPSLRTRLAFRGHGVGAPYLLAGVGREGDQKSPNAAVPATGTNDYFVFRDENRSRRGGAGTHIRELLAKDHGTRTANERGEIVVDGSAIDAVPENSDAATGTLALGTGVGVLPDEAAGTRIKGIDVVRICDVHDSGIDQRSGLQIAGARYVVDPLRDE